MKEQICNGETKVGQVSSCDIKCFPLVLFMIIVFFRHKCARYRSMWKVVPTAQSIRVSSLHVYRASFSAVVHRIAFGTFPTEAPTSAVGFCWFLLGDLAIGMQDSSTAFSAYVSVQLWHTARCWRISGSVRSIDANLIFPPPCCLGQ